MFFPKAMTEVELIIPAKDLAAVTKVLGSRSSFQQIDSTYLGLENLGPSSWQETAANYSTLERHLLSIMQNLNLSEEYSGSATTDASADLSALQSAVERIETEVRAISDPMSAERKKLEQLENQLQQLQPISDLDYEIGSLRKSKYLYSIAGMMPADQVSRLETSLARVPYTFFTLREDPKKPLVWLFGPRSNADIIDRAVRSSFLTPLVLPENFSGSPAEGVKQMSQEIETTKQKISELDRELAKLAATHKKELYSLWRDVHVNRVMAEAISRFGQLRHTYIVVGWVPESQVDYLTGRLRQASPEILIQVVPQERTSRNQGVPVALGNPGFLGAFEGLTTTYARPRYEEIDPTIIIAFTFPLIFGAMFGDAGQGLVMALVGFLLVSKLVPALRSSASFGWVIAACGTSATIFGLLYGSFFGFEDILPESPFFSQFIWIRPLHDPIRLLATYIGAGVVLISSALLLNLYNAWRARDWGRFFFDSHGLAGTILYLSVLALVASLALPGFPIPSVVFIVLIILSTLIGVVFAHPLKHWWEGHPFHIEDSIGMFTFVSFFEVFEKFISMLSNTMSYARVGAFAIAHGGFSLAIFIMARLVSGGEDGGAGYWIVVALGNLVLIGAEGFIVGIQTMRLHYYEFFSKFFTGGGAEYQPLALLNETKS